jgi:hypothetical protein
VHLLKITIFFGCVTLALLVISFLFLLSSHMLCRLLISTRTDYQLNFFTVQIVCNFILILTKVTYNMLFSSVHLACISRKHAVEALFYDVNIFIFFSLKEISRNPSWWQKLPWQYRCEHICNFMDMKYSHKRLNMDSYCSIYVYWFVHFYTVIWFGHTRLV